MRRNSLARRRRIRQKSSTSLQLHILPSFPASYMRFKTRPSYPRYAPLTAPAIARLYLVLTDLAMESLHCDPGLVFYDLSSRRPVLARDQKKPLAILLLSFLSLLFQPCCHPFFSSCMALDGADGDPGTLLPQNCFLAFLDINFLVFVMFCCVGWDTPKGPGLLAWR
jgi:hypothetical protein